MNKMYDLFRLPTHQHLCALGGFFACLLLGFQVNAQTIAASDAAFQRFMWTTTGANSQSVGVGSNGTLVASPTGSGTLAGDGAKSLKYDRPATWRNGSNNPVTGAMSGRVPINPKTAKLLTSGMKLVPFLGTGAALFDLASELGFKPTMSGDSLIVTKNDPTICSVSPCYNWSVRANNGALVGANTELSDALARLRAYSCAPGVSYGPCTQSQVPGSNPPVWKQYAAAGWETAGQAVTEGQRAPIPGTPIPSTIQELEAAIAEKSGWPSTSKLPAALRDAATVTGEKIDVEAPKITGPATSPGTVKTTTGPTTTTTTTTTHGHTYNDNRVTNNVTTSVNVTNNQTGTGETTTTTEEPVEEPTECEKNPDSIGCAELDTPDDEIPKTEKIVSYQAENLGFGGGSCPANVVMTPANMSTPITVINWADNCQKITTYAKPMILAMALFAAMMIIFVGKTE